jgi:hypothetical protein
MSISRVQSAVPNKYIIEAGLPGRTPVLLAADTLSEAIQDVFAHHGQGTQKISLNSVEQPWDGSTYQPAVNPASRSLLTPVSAPAPAGVDPTQYTVEVKLQRGGTKYVPFNTLLEAQRDVAAHQGVGRILHGGAPVAPAATAPAARPPAPAPRRRASTPPTAPARVSARPIPARRAVPTRRASARPVASAPLPAVQTVRTSTLPPLATAQPNRGDFKVFVQPRQSSAGGTSGATLVVDISVRNAKETTQVSLWGRLGSTWVQLETLNGTQVQENSFNRRLEIPLDYAALSAQVNRFVSGQDLSYLKRNLALRVVWSTGHDQGANSGGASASGGTHAPLSLP